jgi:hypothetical protein
MQARGEGRAKGGRPGSAQDGWSGQEGNTVIANGANTFAPGQRPRLRAPGGPCRLALPLAVSLLALGGLAPGARAGSRTAESIWSQSDAQQRAIERIPMADRPGITHSRCQDVGVGRMGSLPRFRCTVWFTPPSSPAQP